MIREALFFLTMICVAVGVSGCGTFSKTADKAKTISKAKCESVNVYDFGYQTARAGLRSDQSKFNDYVKSCGKYGVALNKTKYKKGREAGLKGLCVYQEGYKMGLIGKKYDFVCPENTAKDFLQGYSSGLKLHTSQKNQQQLKKIKARLDQQSAQILYNNLRNHSIHLYHFHHH